MTNPSHEPDPRRLESLLDLAEPVADWSDADLAAMLHHQLAQPLEPGGLTIRELFEHPDPPVESLELLKRLAKVRRARNDAAAPQDLWRVIYFASIAAAIPRGHRISDLSPSDLRQGFQWTLARPWVDATVRRLIDNAVRTRDE